MTSVDRTRLKQLASLKKKPVHQWDVHEVCIWVEDIGLPQHRKRFAHHVVDGKLLLKLTDANLNGTAEELLLLLWLLLWWWWLRVVLCSTKAGRLHDDLHLNFHVDRRRGVVKNLQSDDDDGRTYSWK